MSKDAQQLLSEFSERESIYLQFGESMYSLLSRLIKVANVNKGRIQTVYKDISFINPDPQKNYSETYFLLWETTKNLILPFYQLYILDGEKWRLYSEIPKT